LRGLGHQSWCEVKGAGCRGASSGVTWLGGRGGGRFVARLARPAGGSTGGAGASGWGLRARGGLGFLRGCQLAWSFGWSAHLATLPRKDPLATKVTDGGRTGSECPPHPTASAPPRNPGQMPCASPKRPQTHSASPPRIPLPARAQPSRPPPALTDQPTPTRQHRTPM